MEQHESNNTSFDWVPSAIIVGIGGSLGLIIYFLFFNDTSIEDFQKAKSQSKSISCIKIFTSSNYFSDEYTIKENLISIKKLGIKYTPNNCSIN